MAVVIVNDNAVLSPFPSVSLADEHGGTLDFTHKDGVQYLACAGRSESPPEECSISRITLGYNRLTTLPTAFALFSRLRYLNLKSNNFSSIPDVLTVMPSLEILDISRNKIKRLPTQPGSLVDLHVLCISRNKITRLPRYFTEFTKLDVLKVDHNPIEWPPKEIIEAGGLSSDPRVVKKWILSLQKWLREDCDTQPNNRKPSVDSVKSECAVLNRSIILSWSRLGEIDTGSASVDTQFPLSSESSKNIANTRFERPPPLQLGSLGSYEGPLRPSSPESYLPTPDESVSSTDDDHTAVLEGSQRNGEGSLTRGYRDGGPAIVGKKSVPDMRCLLGERGNDDQPPVIMSESARCATGSTVKDTAKVDDSIPSPLSHRQDSSSSSDASTRLPKVGGTTPPSRGSPTLIDRPRPVPDSERHAYFKRLSALPSNAISNNLPASLLSLVECARSLFFAVSQVYQALSHYITHTLDPQLSSVLRKVTDPAYTYMMQLNAALECFDAMGKKTMPPASLCTSLVESCRDTAAVFGKAMAMLALQLKILASKDDDRYMRSLILTFYGAVAEISHAWQSVVPHIDAVKPRLIDHRKVPAIKGHLATATNLPTPDVPPASAPALYTPCSVPMARSRPAQSKALGRTRTTRRHAGSFSSKDVEIGKSLASYDLPPPPVALSSNAPPTTLRNGQRRPAMPLSASTPSIRPLPASNTFAPSSPSLGRDGDTRHSRQGSQASLVASSSTFLTHVPPKRPTVDIPQSRTLVDEDALDAMERAVDAAPAVWEMMKEFVTSVSEPPATSQDLDDALARAKIITERLRTNLHATRCGDPASDRKALREDAHVFVKIVVQLSSIIKAHGCSHALFPDLRDKMVLLTNSTQEFLMLLHVSSFTPSTTPHPFSPMTNALQPNLASHLDDNKLGASLSRSRSAQQPKLLKLSTLPTRELPRSALPNQTFNITLPSRHVVGIKDVTTDEG
ncbi:RAM signaling pathway protein-domain-containing protein [Pisolithus marmoratus]|nr:RAM signaling pathway protein-domain-containing protein [Pisolithus marmoratus]